jgi:hypothetical protein
MAGHCLLRGPYSPSRARGRNPRSLQSRQRYAHDPAATYIHVRARAEPLPAAQCAMAIFLLTAVAYRRDHRISVLALNRSTAAKAELSWFLIAVLLASPNTASYTFILLLLPVTVVMEEAGQWKRVAFACCFMALTIPMRPSWSWLFPKVWLLLALFGLASVGWRRVQWKPAFAGAALLISLLAITARQSLPSYSQEPGRRWERIAVQPGAIYSSSPAVLRSSIVFQSIQREGYVLGWLHSGRVTTFAFPGQAFHPLALSPEGPICFDLVAKGTAANFVFNPAAGGDFRAGCSSSRSNRPGVSPDGKWFAFPSAHSGSSHLWLRNLRSGTSIQLSGGNCNSFAPAWELDSQSILFASDCGRGIGLPSLYRARLSAIVPR